MAKKLNVGLVGIGRLGRNYAEYLALRVANTQLIALANLKESVMAECARKLNIPKCYRDYRELIADKEVDAVVVTTSTSAHKEIVIAAAKAGKAVFCEKPLSLSLRDAQEIGRVLADTGIFFHMGLVRRFDKGYAAAKQKIQQGVIGNPIVIKSSSRDPFRPSLEFIDPRLSGGIFVDMGIHDFDIARWYLGEVETVFSSGAILAYPEMKPTGDCDNGLVNLTFEKDALGMVDLSRSGVYGYDIRTEILGTKGTLKIGYLRETPILVMNKVGVHHDTVPYFMQRFGDAFIAQLQNFAEHYLKGRDPSVTCADGIQALKISLAAKKSHEEKRAVTIQEIESMH